MTGFGAFSISIEHVGKHGAPARGLPNSVMSAPAMKVRPAQMRTIALTAAFATAASTPRFRPSRTGCDSALTGGELIVTIATSPSIVSSATELIAAIAFLRFGETGCGAL